MKITADNRGRVALSKIAFNGSKYGTLAHTEWSSEVKNGRVILTPWQEEKPKEDEWVRISPEQITPEMIGEVVGAYAVSDSNIPQPGEDIYGTKCGLYAKLMSYSTSPQGVVQILLEGRTKVVSTHQYDDNPRLRHLWAKASLLK